MKYIYHFLIYRYTKIYEFSHFLYFVLHNSSFTAQGYLFVLYKISPFTSYTDAQHWQVYITPYKPILNAIYQKYQRSKTHTWTSIHMSTKNTNTDKTTLVCIDILFGTKYNTGPPLM